MHRLGSFTTLFLLSLSLARSADAADHFLSVSGLDGNDGSSPSEAWGTFDHALGQLLPGDRLVVVDGQYTRATTGLPFIDCTPGTGNASSGSPGAPITLLAQNERQAHMDASSLADPSHRAFEMKDCSYWVVEGLHIEGEQKPTGGANLMAVVRSDHIELRRLLIHGSNVCANSHLLNIAVSDEVLLEESELYDFHRHAATGFHSTNLTYRRNYVNGDNGLATCEPYLLKGREGSEPLSFYPADSSLMENNISEASNSGLGGHASNEVTGLDPVGLHDNLFIGNISLDNFRGIGLDGRCWEAPVGSCPWVNEAANNHVENNVFYFDNTFFYGDYGMSIIGNLGFTARNNSILGAQHAAVRSGVLAKLNASSIAYQSGQSVSFVNTLITEANLIGFDTTDYDDDPESSWSAAALNVFDDHQTSIVLPLAAETLSTQSDPQLGACIVFIPDSSPMKAAGQAGDDLGANVLFRYQDGVLSDETLWDATTGEFPCGAIVPGVNDIPGSSCFDVHERLHVNSGGCSLPDWYDSDSDGIRNRGDNCSAVANFDQLDHDDDGFGNACDCDFLQESNCVSGPGAGGLGDSDQDGLADNVDNCPLALNASQRDDDLDGFGNACDCDFNQDDVCDLSDALRFLNDFCADNPSYDDGTVDCTAAPHTNLGPETDMNDDGVVDLGDGPFFDAVQANGIPGPGATMPGDVAVAVEPPTPVPALPAPFGVSILVVALFGAGARRLRSGMDRS